MSKFCLSRFVAAALIAISGAALVTASFDAEARRAGGGSSVGRQSSNVTQQRQATTPPAAANNTAGATAAPAAAGAATAGAAGAAAKSGASRWLGPIAGIAAGLGIAALLSSMGLSGAFAEFLGSALLIAAVVFAVMFIIRRLRGAGPRTATQGAFNGSNNTPGQQQQPMWRESLKPAAPAAAAAVAAPVAAAAPAAMPKAGDDNNWFVPGDFDTPNFLKQAKDQFVRIQAVWDSGSTDGLREFLTDDLITELKPQLAERGAAPNKTEVVLLNAEMLGIETVSDGHLASVRFSGMLREAPGAEAFRFEEVWNLFKPANGGWLLAGIQQIPVDLAS
ncbi:Tim44 domain-containing protein [Achromobacter sp. SD115]|uniref:Tim44-like domain protein n=1 Tax=Achromobacter xylosoxidans (strain A8) TaxID=762376 RepID=E3HVJ1_ACHXA|nr:MULTISPECIES: TIM44-like domain-containing protein [Achromobacter]ADP13856.1 Tim44-like domain protein [Achromobacter xylosoxidans A8]MBO1015315.1 Tim44 domain-containing protein [Achromobacter sp. SD115]